MPKRDQTWYDRYGGVSAYNKFKGTLTSPPGDAFMSGKMAMIVDINGYVSQLKAFNPQYTAADGTKSNLDWGVADYPYNTTEASTSGGFALSIPRGAKNPDAAWEFIKCATSPQGQLLWSKGVYDIPANQEAAKDPSLMSDPSWPIFLHAMTYTQGGNFVPGYANWGEQMGKVTPDVFAGKISAEDAVKKAQQAIDDTISQNQNQ